MFDFWVVDITRTGIIICAIFYFVTVAVFWKQAVTLRLKPSVYRVPVIFTLIFIFSLISWTNGDWFHYLIIVKRYASFKESGLENFYELIIKLTHSNYFLFRCIVWGLALSFFTLSLREFKVDYFKALFFLFAVFINYFDYSRSSLGMATYFLGLGMLFGEKKIIIRIIGIGIMLCSLYFHRSMMIPLCLTPICFIPIDKKTIFIILVLVALLFGVLKDYFTQLLGDLMSSEDENLAKRAELYGNDERKEIVAGNFMGQLISYWKYSVFYVLYGFVSFAWFKYNLYKYLPIRYRALYGMATGLLITSILLYLFDKGNAAIYYRTLFMIYIPLTLLTVFFFTRRIFKPKIFTFLLLYCGGYVAFEFFSRSISGA